MRSLRDRWSQLIRNVQPRRGAAPASSGNTRSALIERKAAVQAEAAQIRRELGGLRSSGTNPARAAGLEAQLERLVAEERRLRLEIDRTRQDGDAPP